MITDVSITMLKVEPNYIQRVACVVQTIMPITKLKETKKEYAVAYK